MDFDASQNMFIEGDNLDVLKVLQKSYYKKVKMIYIDPPYNTGNDFIYFDKFKENQDDYLKASGERDEDGNARKTFRKNSKESGHYHSNWMNMMYPRLFLAKNLLHEDGVIFVSIDDNEVYNLRLIMNEIFGEENFVAQFIWKNKKGGGNDAKFIAVEHEYILMYAKNIDTLNELFYSFSLDYIERYKESDEVGRYFWDTLKRKTGKQYYAITCPDGTILEKDDFGNPISWLRSEKRFKEDYTNGDVRIIKVNNKWSVHFKQRLPDGKKPRSIIDTFGTTGDGSAFLLDTFKGNLFSNPKPCLLVKHLINFGTSKNSDDIILDFFAGSGTTAQAVMELNQEDGGYRKFILVQLPEVVAEDSEAHKAGYATIADISRERIRRVIAKLKKNVMQSDVVIPSVVEGSPVDAEKISRQARNDNTQSFLSTLNFKSFLLTPSNFKIWRGDDIRDEETLLARIEDSIDNIKPDSKKYNMLYELLIKQGIEPTAPVEDKGDYSIIGDVIVCFAEPMTQEIITRIIAEKPQITLFVDRSFHGNPQLKTNASLQMHDNKIEFKVI